MQPELRTDRPLRHYRDTVREIFRLAREYCGDVSEYIERPIGEYYRIVKSLSYVADPKGEETVSRPGLLIRPELPDRVYRDCDDKTVLIAAYCEAVKRPYRICIVGQARDKQGKPYPHHVYPEALADWGDWVPLDATFPDRGEMGQRLYNEIFRRVYYT